MTSRPTHHSTGPARKAAQAGEFRRWAPCDKVTSKIPLYKHKVSNSMIRILRHAVLSAGLCVTFCGSASASTWNFLWVGNEDTRYFFDADTVEKNRDITTVWIKTVQTTRPDDDGSWATALRWKINCTKRTIQALAMSLYDRDGKFIRSINTIGQESAVIPDSTGEGVLKIACEPNFPRDTSGSKYFKLDSNDVFQATRNYVEMKKSQIDSAPK